MRHLTHDQQVAIGTIILLLLTGWAVKAWRTAHPPQPPAPAAQAL